MSKLLLILFVSSLIGCKAQKRGSATPKVAANSQQKTSPQTAVDMPAPPKAPPVKGNNEPVVMVPPAKSEPSSSMTAPLPQKPEAPQVAQKPESQKTESQKTESQKTESQKTSRQVEMLDRTTLELNFEETLTLYQMLGQLFGSNTPHILTPKLPLGIKLEEYASQLKGTREKADFRIQVANQAIVSFQDVRVELEKPLQAKVKGSNEKDFVLIGICIGAECEILFVSAVQMANKKAEFNYPGLFKRVDGNYKSARRLNNKEFEEKYKQMEKDAFDPEKMPPQIKVQALYEKNLENYGNQTLESIRKMMKEQKTIYSARLFPNLKSPTCDPEFKVSQTTVDFKNSCEFTDYHNRKAENFSGSLSGDETVLKSSEGMELKVIVVKEATDLVKGQGFYELHYRQPKHKTPLAEEPISAMQSRLCQVLVDKGTAYTHCQFVPTERVFAGLAFEGHYDGPLYVRDDNQYKPVILRNREGLPQLERPPAEQTRKSGEVTSGD